MRYLCRIACTPDNSCTNTGALRRMAARRTRSRGKPVLTRSCSALMSTVITPGTLSRRPRMPGMHLQMSSDF
eukprot:365466-Chlamydomonas_euryale.AAC.18